MKKQLLFLALFFIKINASYSQIKFEPGYFISDTDQKVECLIKNVDWKYNPTAFEYMLSPDAAIQKASIATVKEFGINDVAKYIRSTVKIDRSSNNIRNLSSERNPVFQEEQLFLKVFIEGKASLFLYEEGNITRYFLKTNDSPITQLVYKEFLLENKVAQNNDFRQQLFNELQCEAMTMKDFQYIKYDKRDLERCFIKFNECANANYVDYEKKQKRDLLNLSLRPGSNLNNVVINNPNSSLYNTDFENKFGFRFGIEVETVLPFNKGKWSIIFEPTYQYYKSIEITEYDHLYGGILNSAAHFRYIELPVGIRHYFFLNDNSKIFANICFDFSLKNNSTIEYSRRNGSKLNSLEVDPRRDLTLGMGYKYKTKYIVEVRYQTGGDLFSGYYYWTANYNMFSLILGYSIF